MSKRIFLCSALCATFMYATYYQFTQKIQEQYSQEEKTVDRSLKVNLSGKPMIPPFIDIERHYSIAPDYNISFCYVKKSMSTMMSGISCALRETEGFLKNNRSILEMWDIRFCNGRNEFENSTDIQAKFPEYHETFTKLAVIRDPISRFISFFVDKCLYEAKQSPHQHRCYDCLGNITCFLEKQYERFVALSSNESSLVITYEDRHAAPISWNCELAKYMHQYTFVKIDADPENKKKGIEKIMSILKERNVSDDLIEFFKKSASEGETSHSTYNSEAHDLVKKQIDESETIRSWLRSIYYMDYVIFGFDTRTIER